MEGGYTGPCSIHSEPIHIERLAAVKKPASRAGSLSPLTGIGGALGSPVTCSAVANVNCRPVPSIPNSRTGLAGGSDDRPVLNSQCLGGEPQSLPTAHGFDEFYGIPRIFLGMRQPTSARLNSAKYDSK
jgi:hypothetical protein